MPSLIDIQAWGHELNGADPNLRQLLVATGNIFTYTFSAFIPCKSSYSYGKGYIALSRMANTPSVVLFPTYDAPHYKYAYQILILFGGLAIISTFILEWQERRER